MSFKNVAKKYTVLHFRQNRSRARVRGGGSIGCHQKQLWVAEYALNISAIRLARQIVFDDCFTLDLQFVLEHFSCIKCRRLKAQLWLLLACWNLDTAEEKGRRVIPQNFSFLARLWGRFWSSARQNNWKTVILSIFGFWMSRAQKPILVHARGLKFWHGREKRLKSNPSKFQFSSYLEKWFLSHGMS